MSCANTFKLPDSLLDGYSLLRLPFCSGYKRLFIRNISRKVCLTICKSEIFKLFRCIIKFLRMFCFFKHTEYFKRLSDTKLHTVVESIIFILISLCFSKSFSYFFETIFLFHKSFCFSAHFAPALKAASNAEVPAQLHSGPSANASAASSRPSGRDGCDSRIVIAPVIAAIEFSSQFPAAI